jgi:pimeloyl-[acyl-carrier protein] methyl ester esterase
VQPKGLSLTVCGRGAPLVLIPGWAMHSGVWGEFAARLAQAFLVLSVDLPGHGLSPRWEHWTLKATANKLANAIPERALCLGWSLGGQVALELAWRHPAKVAGLVLLASNPKFLAEGCWPGMAPEIFEAFVRGVETQTQATLQRFLALCCLGGEDCGQILHRLQRAWEAYPAPSLAVLRQGLEILRRTDLRGKLAQISCPVTVVAGQKDRLVPKEALEQLAASLPKARFKSLEGAGHVPFLSHPKELADLVREFAADVRQVLDTAFL